MKDVLRSWLPGALVAVALPLLLYILSNQIYGAGHRAGADEIQSRWNAHKAEQADQHADDLYQLKLRNDALQAQLAAQETDHQKETDRVQAENDDFVAGVRSGRIRLSIPTKGAGAPEVCKPDPAHGAPSAGPPEEARAELEPAAAANLVAITNDGDDAIRDLNACIDRYNTVRASINAPFTLTDVQGQ